MVGHNLPPLIEIVLTVSEILGIANLGKASALYSTEISLSQLFFL
jgi:hypothetical protein